MKDLTSKQSSKIIKEIRSKLSDYFKKHNKTYAVFGKSKGVDSSLAAGILSNIKNIKPMGVLMPIDSDKKDEEIGKLVLNHFNIPFLKVDLTSQYKDLACKLYLDNKVLLQLKNIEKKYNYKNLEKTFKQRKNFALGNIKARLRMIILYHLAQITNGIVIGAGNFSEYWTGFWTLHGDVGDINPIAPLYKSTEVYSLAKALGVPKKSLEAIPSDGLNITKKGTDEDQLGLNYKNLDKIIKNYLKGKDIKQIKYKTNIKEEKIKKALEKIKNSEYKRKNPINFTRKDLGLKD
jgi:NAD+ synthetase